MRVCIFCAPCVFICVCARVCGGGGSKADAAARSAEAAACFVCVFLLWLSQSWFGRSIFCPWKYIQYDLICHCQQLTLFVFSLDAGGRRQPTFTNNSDVSTRNLYCTNLDIRSLHKKWLKSRTNTQAQSLHRRRPSRQSCTPTVNSPSCKRRRGTVPQARRGRGNSSWRRSWRR